MKLIVITFAAMAVAFAQAPAAPAKDAAPASTTHKEAKKHTKKHAKKGTTETPAPAAK